jgi:hypothetical protein
MMKKTILNIIWLTFIITSVNYAQFSRTAAMGDLSFSIIDADTKFDPFQLGGNPAYLWQSRKKPRLDFTQFNSADYGDYRRRFSSERNFNVGANVIGIQPLGESGTFQGRAVYYYNKRSNVYRTLKKDTYAGEAFFFTDTTTGDVVYDGPLFEFTHSLPLTEKISVGGTFGYGLLNGLKKVYTYGETVFRNVYGTFGVTYSVNDNLTLGADFAMFNTQERIVASDVNLFTVITYHYRGDTHRIQLSGSKQKYKVSKSGNRFGGEIYYTPSEKLEIGINGGYQTSSTESIFPVEGMEKVDGYSWFRDASLEIKTRYFVNEQITLGVVADYLNSYSWSENRNNSLLLWEWDYSDIGAGFGGSYSNILPGLLLGFEYKISATNSDSSKYIDNKFNSLSSTNHNVKLGGEYLINSLYSIRFGFVFGTMRHDFVYGGDNVDFKKITGGFGINLTDNFVIDVYGFWGRLGYSSSVKRDYWDARITFRFYKF